MRSAWGNAISAMPISQATSSRPGAGAEELSCELTSADRHCGCEKVHAEAEYFVPNTRRIDVTSAAYLNRHPAKSNNPQRSKVPLPWTSVRPARRLVPWHMMPAVHSNMSRNHKTAKILTRIRPTTSPSAEVFRGVTCFTIR